MDFGNQHHLFTQINGMMRREGTIRLYHGSCHEFPKGFVLKPQANGYVHAVQGDQFDAGIKQIEEVFERHRPSQLISRLEAVFLAPSIDEIAYAGGHMAHVYQVKPIGECDRSYLWWYDEIERSVLDGQRLPSKLARECAEKYWQNVPPPAGKPAYYECRCRAARIVYIVR